MDTIIALIRSLIEKSPTRLIGYGSIAATTAALWLAAQLGVTLAPEFLTAVGIIGAGIVTELIRRLVYSPNTTQKIADRAAVTGNPDIGDPPKGPTAVAGLPPGAPEG